MRTTALASPEFYRSTSGKGNSIWEMRSVLQKRTTIFFAILILLASLLSGLAIFQHNSVESNQINEPVTIDQTTMNGENAPAMAGAARHDGIELSITMLSLAIVGVLVFFMLFIRIKVIGPLHRLEEISRRMADGSFDMLAKGNYKTSSYVDTIGENVNSLAMNLQEILLLVWNHSEHNLGELEKTITLLADNPGNTEVVMTNLQAIKNEMQQMQELTKQFELFDVTLEGKRALAKDGNVNP